MPKTYNDLYLATRTALKSAGVEAYALEARLLVAYAVGKTKEEFVRDLRLYTSDGTVHIICTYEHGEVRTDAFLLALGDICIDFSFILESVNGCQFCFDRSYTFLVQLHAIHCDIIKIAYFLRSTARCVIFLRCQFGNQCFQLFTTVFAQHVECTET